MIQNRCCYLRFAEYTNTASMLAVGLIAFLAIEEVILGTLSGMPRPHSPRPHCCYTA